VIRRLGQLNECAAAKHAFLTLQFGEIGSFVGILVTARLAGYSRPSRTTFAVKQLPKGPGGVF
jgi:hypothetical protein